MDLIRDFDGTGDVIAIVAGVNGSGIGSAADALARSTASGADTLIDLGAGNSVLLVGFARGSLAADDFLIL